LISTPTDSFERAVHLVTNNRWSNGKIAGGAPATKTGAKAPPGSLPGPEPQDRYRTLSRGWRVSWRQWIVILGPFGYFAQFDMIVDWQCPEMESVALAVPMWPRRADLRPCRLYTFLGILFRDILHRVSTITWLIAHGRPLCLLAASNHTTIEKGVEER
jgi:hypothetical protein